MTALLDGWEQLAKSEIGAKAVQELAESLLANPNRIEKLAYTCMHPEHQRMEKHLLGSVEGNMHFLMGYANPAFAVAPYHYKAINPLLTDNEAALLCKSQGNPSRMKEQDLPAEGEVSSTTKKFGASAYSFSEGMVQCQKMKSTYAAELLPISYLPTVSVEKSTDAPEVTVDVIPDLVKSLCMDIPDTTFDENVYTFIKSTFPSPSSCVQLSYQSGGDVYAIIDSSSVKFYNKVGERTGIEVFSKRYTELDLLRDGNTHPSILLNFAEKKLGIATDLVKSYSE